MGDFRRIVRDASCSQREFEPVTETQYESPALFVRQRSRVGPMTESGISSEDAPIEDTPQSDPIPDPTAGPSVAPDHLGGPLVVISNVDKHFGQLHVLQDINLTVRKGEVVVVLGPSGSGKSTLCRVINRLETIESGTITIDGEQLPEEGKGLAHLRADVGDR